MESETRITLRPEFFGEKERLLVEQGELTASGFRFDSGVAGLRMRNGRGELVVLPFQGQQIWDARFDGRILTMRTLFCQPRATREFLGTYGGFLLHCGATAMGNPGAGDTHPVHGELPNAPYDSASLVLGGDDARRFMALCGEYRHTVAFRCDYAARPRVTLRAGAAVVPIAMEIVNLGKAPMELMYLAHVNFRPVDGGRLVTSAPCNPQAMRVRTLVPSGIHPPAGYKDLLAALARDPSRHTVMAPEMAFDPEVVMTLSMKADARGWARSLMIHPDGLASYVGYDTRTLDHGVRWISRTADQDCLGLLLPATAEPDGYLAEKAKGNVKSLPGGTMMRFELEAGLLDADEARAMEAGVERILAGR